MKKSLLTIVSIVIAIAVAACMLTVFVGCDKGNNNAQPQEVVLPAYEVEGGDYSSLQIPATFKIGLICLHDENSTYDKNFIDAMKEVQREFGLTTDQVKIASGVPENDQCYAKACELAEAGCKVIIADSFDHENFMMQAAERYSDVIFAHATGTQAHTSELPNFVNAFASIYEGRYLAGVAAGLKLKEMIANGVKIKGQTVTANSKVGYVGAYPYAEVKSGYTSWFLGLRSVEGLENITMEVQFTSDWYNYDKEYNAASNLIQRGCVLISQHADSMGAPNACEEAGVPNVSYNGSTFEACPDTFLVSSRINWAPYYKYLIACAVNGEAPVKDYTGTIATGSVELTNLGAACAAGTVDQIVTIRQELALGRRHVFDTSKFTVGGEHLTEYLADVDTDPAWTADTNVIHDGYFDESFFRAAPYFDINIDGITLLN